MISVHLCNPDAGQPFASFIHNTTTYVGVPHQARSQLWVTTERPRYLTIEAENQQVIANQLVSAPGTSLLISDMKQPPKPSSALGGIVPPFFRRRGKVPTKPPLRLYAFRVILSRKPLDQDPTPEATFDFHLLCAEDFEWAKSFELQLYSDPAAIAPATIGDVAEGTCAVCAEVRERLRRDWLSE